MLDPKNEPTCREPRKFLLGTDEMPTAEQLASILTGVPARVNSIEELADTLRSDGPPPSLRERYPRAAETKKETYAYHQPSVTGLSKINAILKAFKDLHALIEEVAPMSRERSTAITQLETAAMWAIKAVVINDPDSVPKPIEG